MSDTTRIHVLKDDIPSFLVHTLVGDNFISEMVTELFGTRIDGSGWEWEAEEVVLSEKDFAVAGG